MAASLPELVRGITGAVSREDAKKLARLHGHPWKAVLKAMKRRARASFAGVDRSPNGRLLDDFVQNSGPGAAEVISQMAEQLYGKA